MQIRVFTIPISNPSAMGDLLKAFLRSHRVVNVSKQYASDAENNLWTVFVEYLIDTCLP